MTRKVLIGLTDQQLNEVNKMVKIGMYGSRSEAVRDAVRQLVEARMKRIEALATETAKLAKGRSIVKEIVKEHERG